MHALYILSVYLHVLAAITWIGGMFFLVLVVVPWLRRGDRQKGAMFLRETGIQFRNVGWACFGILLVTGTFQLYFRGVGLTDFVRPEWLHSSFGRTVILKLGVFALVLISSVVHDFFLGPRATIAVEKDPRSAEAERFRRQASLLGRANVIFALLLVAFGVMLVRGNPFG